MTNFYFNLLFLFETKNAEATLGISQPVQCANSNKESYISVFILVLLYLKTTYQHVFIICSDASVSLTLQRGFCVCHSPNLAGDYFI